MTIGLETGSGRVGWSRSGAPGFIELEGVSTGYIQDPRGRPHVMDLHSIFSHLGREIEGAQVKDGQEPSVTITLALSYHYHLRVQ